jgi:hypothetical protein
VVASGRLGWANALHRIAEPLPRRVAIALALLALFWMSYGQTNRGTEPRYRLFNGWGLSPVGHPIPLPGDLPAHILTSSDSKYLFVNATGFNQRGVCAIDLAMRKVAHSIDLAKSWVGLTLLKDNRLLVSGGGPMPPEPTYWGVVSGLTTQSRTQLGFPAYVLEWRNRQLIFSRPILLPSPEKGNRFIAGVTRGRDDSVYIVDSQNDTVFRLEGDDFRVAAVGTVGYRPYEISVSADGLTVAVSNWGDETVSILEPRTLKERPAYGPGCSRINWRSDRTDGCL